MEELTLADSRLTPAALQERLSELSGLRVLLMLTDNAKSMIAFKREAGGLVTLRAHHMFLRAPEAVLQCVAGWLAGRRSRRDLVQEFIDANSDLVRPAAAAERATVIRVAGSRFNLRDLRNAVNDLYLEGRSRAEVTWGRRPARGKSASVRLGAYDPARNLITISRRLDRADIPRYMVEYVMFHEMLHEVLGIGERPDGRRDIHGRTFRLMEQTYPHYEKAKAFEKAKWG